MVKNTVDFGDQNQRKDVGSWNKIFVAHHDLTTTIASIENIKTIYFPNTNTFLKFYL